MKLIEEIMIDSADSIADFIQLPILIFRKKTFQLFHESEKKYPTFSKEIIAHLSQLPSEEVLNLFYLPQIKGHITYFSVFGEEEYLILIYKGEDKITNNPFPVEIKELLKSGIILYQMIFQEKLNYEELFEKNQHIISPLLADKSIEVEMIPIREESKFHKTYISEKYLGECVIRGDVTELKRAFSNYMDNGTAGKLSNNSIRHKKNILISVITMTTRSAIQGGLPEEEAYLMSDLYIQGLEELTELENISKLAYNVMIDFADKVKQHQKGQVSYKILSCQKYIINHLYEKVSVSEMAEELHVNVSYLSSQFKKETGQTITHYIQKQRVEEAKQLILFSDYPFSRIYTLLNFTDQSHFIKIFKKYTGTTPKKFQNQYIYHASSSRYY